MGINIILTNEDDRDYDVLKVEEVLMVDGTQYAVMYDDSNYATFGVVLKNPDGTMRIADIQDDEEFNCVRELYMQKANQ